MLLAHTPKHPNIARRTDNVRLLKELAKLSLITAKEAEQLTQAYLDYRNIAHRLALQNMKLIQTNQELLEHQHNVSRIWEKYLLIKM
jgi:glutamate-ammonia-ligase adenylyltransferase